jgi:hypothetical protein
VAGTRFPLPDPAFERDYKHNAGARQIQSDIYPNIQEIARAACPDPGLAGIHRRIQKIPHIKK